MQLMQVDELMAARELDHVPETHCVHEPAPKSAQAPATQLMHVPLLVAPSAADALPARQFKQEVLTKAPRVDEYIPAEQLMHVVLLNAPTAVEIVPAPQLRHESVEVAANDDEYVPATQLRQTALEMAPTELDHVPAMQFVHVEAAAAE